MWRKEGPGPFYHPRGPCYTDSCLLRLPVNNGSEDVNRQRIPQGNFITKPFAIIGFMDNQKVQNEISHIYLQGSDLANRKQKVLQDASKKLGFKAKGISGTSNWWGSKEIGAFFAEGIYNNLPAVLKIQGVKPTISEIYMIHSFTKTNKSKLVRPPLLYACLQWDEEKRYEALILES